VGFILSGAMDGRMDDGTEFEIRPGDVFEIPPGHNNWVIGDEPMVTVIWGGWRGWGKPPVGERILTTMLMTDIAGSTDRVSAMGDAGPALEPSPSASSPPTRIHRELSKSIEMADRRRPPPVRRSGRVTMPQAPAPR
jgi:hypothetical protein